jgi:hypothetical protein
METSAKDPLQGSGYGGSDMAQSPSFRSEPGTAYRDNRYLSEAPPSTYKQEMPAGREHITSELPTDTANRTTIRAELES